MSLMSRSAAFGADLAQPGAASLARTAISQVPLPSVNVFERGIWLTGSDHGVASAGVLSEPGPMRGRRCRFRFCCPREHMDVRRVRLYDQNVILAGKGSR